MTQREIYEAFDANIEPWCFRGPGQLVEPHSRRLTDAKISEIWFKAGIPGLTETNARLLIRAAEKELGIE